jgi:hypothetical protein
VTGIQLFVFRAMIVLALPPIMTWAFIDRLISEMKLAFRMAWLDVRSLWGDAIETWDDAARLTWAEMKTKVEKSRE